MKNIWQNLRQNRRNGYTLIELLVIIAIIGAITAVMAMTINMALNITTKDSAQSILFSQVHQAASWIAKDVASADNITPDNGTTLLSLIRYQLNGTADNITTTNTITYVVDNNKNLLRKVNGNSGTIVAQYIRYPTYTTFTAENISATENNTYILKLQAMLGNSSYNQIFKIYQRVP